METSHNNSSADKISALINQLTNLTSDNSIQNENSKNIQVILNSGANNDVKELYIKSLIDAQLSRNEAQLSRNEAQLSRNEAQLSRNDAANEKKRRIEETGAGFLKLMGLPPLPKSKVSISRPSYGNHPFNLEPVDHVKDVVIGVPSCCKISELDDDLPSHIWKQTERNEITECGRILSSWNNEVGIENFVYCVVMDIIALLKLNPSVEVCRQVKITLVEHLTPDIILMEFNGKLIGICEVKQPSFGKSDLCDLDENLQNQISNYLMQLKNMYGVQTPIGIISVICFLSESYDYMKFSEQSDSFIPPVVSSAPPPVKGKTTLFTSKVYNYNDKCLIEVLAATVYKMYHSVANPPISLIRSNGNEIRKFGYANATGFVWKVLSPKLKTLTYEMPTSKTRNFYFIQDFHGGKDGRVWLTMSETGKIAVCKLSKVRDYEHEADLWNTIWGPKLAYTTTLLDAKALIMPFVFHAHIRNDDVIFRPFGSKWSSGDSTIDDIRNSEIPGNFNSSLEYYFNQPLLVAEEALRHMVMVGDNGYKHCDIEWRHVGLLPFKIKDVGEGEWAVKPVLIDLHDTIEISGEFDKEAFIQDALCILNYNSSAI